MSIRFPAFSSSLFLVGLALMPAGLAPTAMAAGTAEKPCETDLCRSVRQSWAAVRHGTSNAADWTATTNGTKEAVHATGAWTKKTAHELDPGSPAKAPDSKADSAAQ